jgi:hypothetical protein
MQIPDIIYHLTWEGSCVRKTLNQVDQKLINARFFGIGPGMFGLIQGWIDASVAENSPHSSPHVILTSLSILSFRRLDNRLVSRKSKNGAFRYDVSMAFVRSVT